MTDKKLLVLATQRITVEDRDKFMAIAAHKGVSMTGQMRMWIRESYDKLPKEAK